VARDHVLLRAREPLERVVALEHVALVVQHPKHAARFDVCVEVRGVGREHDVAAFGLHAHALQSLRVAADLVHGDARCDFVRAVVELHAAREHAVHHARDVVGLERVVELVVAHAAARDVFHLGVLHVELRVGNRAPLPQCRSACA